MVEGKKRSLVAPAGFRQKPGIVLGHLVHTIYLCAGGRRIRGKCGWGPGAGGPAMLAMPEA
jgi:hypothetical protein